MNYFCERTVNIAIFALFCLAMGEIVMCSIQGTAPVHTGTCIGAIAGVIITKE